MTYTDTLEYREALRESRIQIAEKLWTTLLMLNADPSLAYQAPGTAYQHTSDALVAVLTSLVGKRLARATYETLLDTMSVREALAVPESDRLRKIGL